MDTIKKTLGEKGKFLITSNFLFFLNVFINLYGLHFGWLVLTRAPHVGENAQLWGAW